MGEVAISVEGLSKSYNIFKKVHALQGVSFEVERGDIFALIGPNGAGKTTLMGCLLGLLHPGSGKITIFGKPPDDFSVRKVTGFLPERPSFESWMTAKQFLKFHHMLAGRPACDLQKDIAQALEDVGLSEVGERRINKFSRGMLQRLGLAQVLIGKPKLCFLDEPTSGMDPPGMELVRNLLVRFKQEGTTVIVNSHHLDEVERVCNRFAFLRGGKIEAQENVGAAHTRTLVVHWPQGSELLPDSEKLADIASATGAEVAGIIARGAKFTLADRADASIFIREMVGQGVEIEEVFFEKSSLSDLFRENGGQP